MREFRLRIYTGPTIVAQVAALFSRNGAFDIIEGTEHVYCTVQANGYDELYLLNSLVSGIRLGKGIQILRESPAPTKLPVEDIC